MVCHTPLRFGITVNRREPTLFYQFDRASMARRSNPSITNGTRSAAIIPILSVRGAALTIRSPVPRSLRGDVEPLG